LLPFFPYTTLFRSIRNEFWNSSDGGGNDWLSSRHRFCDDCRKNVARAAFVWRGSEDKNVATMQRGQDVILRLLASKMNSFTQILSADALMQFLAQSTLAYYF